jgi:hypothetical protein
MVGFSVSTRDFYHEDGTEQAKDRTNRVIAGKIFPADGGFKGGLSG